MLLTVNMTNVPKEKQPVIYARCSTTLKAALLKTIKKQKVDEAEFVRRAVWDAIRNPKKEVYG